MILVAGIDSTWSLRAWICGRLAGIDMTVRVIDLSAPGYKQEILNYSPSGLVPALLTDGFVVHDSLAIAEYFNECANGVLLPPPGEARAVARSLCAEMHSGFAGLRSRCPFTLQDVEPLTGFSEKLRKELDRVEGIFAGARLPFMFEEAGMVDAFYAIMAMRLRIYGILLPGKAGAYQQSLLDWPLLQQAMEEAKRWANS